MNNRITWVTKLSQCNYTPNFRYCSKIHSPKFTNEIEDQEADSPHTMSVIGLLTLNLAPNLILRQNLSSERYPWLWSEPSCKVDPERTHFVSESFWLFDDKLVAVR